MATRREALRQRVWQESRLVEGKCSICGIEALYRDERCLECYLKKYLIKRKGFPKNPRLLEMVRRQLRNELRYVQKVVDNAN